MSTDVKADLYGRLEELWAELERRGARVNRIPQASHPTELRVKVQNEERRLRALDEGTPR